MARTSAQSRPEKTSAAGRSSSTTSSSPRHALLVLGMHRSGTSALTGVLARCGAALPQHLMDASPQNERGYFESTALYELHDALLAEAGARWDDPASIGPGWLDSPVAEDWIARLVQAARKEFAETPFFVVKDPRVSRLVPIWLRVLDRLGATASFLIAVRNPLEVAASLEKAQRTPVPRGLLLWLRYFLDAEHDTRNHPRCFVRYDDLLSDWKGTIRRVGQTLKIEFPRVSPAAAAEIDDFLSEQMRNHSVAASAIGVRDDVGAWIKQTYGWALRAAGGGRPGLRSLDRIASEVGAAEQAYGSLLAKEEYERNRERDERMNVEKALSGRDSDLARIRADVERLTAELEVGARETKRSNAQLAARQYELNQLIDWIRWSLQWAYGGENPQAPGGDPARALDGIETCRIPEYATRALERSERPRELISLRTQLRELRDAFAARSEELDRARADVDARNAEVERITVELSAVEEASAKQTEELARFKKQCLALGQQTERLLKEAATHDARMYEIGEQLRIAQTSLADRDLYVEVLRERLADTPRSLLGRLLRPIRILAQSVRRDRRDGSD